MMELMDSSLINRGEFGRFSYYPLSTSNAGRLETGKCNQQLQNRQLVLKKLRMLYPCCLTRVSILNRPYKCRT
jgi:hypothetical protein